MRRLVLIIELLNLLLPAALDTDTTTMSGMSTLNGVPIFDFSKSKRQIISVGYHMSVPFSNHAILYSVI